MTTKVTPDVVDLSSTPLTVAQGGTGAATHTAHNLLVGNGTSAITSLAPSTTRKVAISDGTDWTARVLQGADLPAGSIVQAPVHTQSGAVLTGTTQTPSDDSTPLAASEGTALTALNTTITPTNASNKLVIEVTVYMATSAAGQLTVSLHQDSTSAAIACGAVYAATTNALYQITFKHEMTAGTTSATTFKLYFGNSNAATNTINGASAARLYGGIMASSMRVTEVKV